MVQPNTVAIPTPPAPPQTPAEQIRDAARRIADQALSQARQEIQGQLDAARAERQALQARRQATRSEAAQASMDRDLSQLDLKIDKLQDALDKIGARTSPTPSPRVFTGTAQAPPPGFPMQNIDIPAIVGTSLGILFVAFPLTLAIVRFIWKRSTSAPPPPLTVEQARRFDRLEQSVDAIAIEIERISENQRYLTKVLAESKQTAKIGG